MSKIIKRELNLEDYTKYYSVGTYCANCGEHDSIYVLKGHIKPKAVVCQECGCDTAKT